MTSVDDFVITEKIYPDFLKIDVEGYELEVLKGARTTLQNVSLIQFEFGGTGIDSRIYFRDFYDLLSKKGFGIYRLAPFSLVPIEVYTEHEESFLYSNFFCIKEVIGLLIGGVKGREMLLG